MAWFLGMRPVPHLSSEGEDREVVTLERSAQHHKVKVLLAAILAGAVISLWLKSAFPVMVRGDLIHDDALFVRLARSLTAGHWLGDFDNRTLVKGAGYPIFIMTCFVVGIPLKTGEMLLYLSTASLLSLVVFQQRRSLVMGLMVFYGLAFNPLLWSQEVSRVIRDSFYIPLSLLLILVSFVAAFKRPATKIWYELFYAIIFGIVLSWYWLTREEGVWLVPSLSILFLAGIISASQKYLSITKACRLIIGRFIGSSVIALLIISSVAAINYYKYGSFETVEVKSPAFEKAYGALYRVKPDHWARFVVFPKDVREQVYTASPAARELMPVFEGKIGNGWRLIGCPFSTEPGCPEILAGWFQWAFRDAVAEAGHYKNAGTAAAYYNRLGDEIDSACERRILDCTGNRHSLAPAFKWSYVSDAAKRIPEEAEVFWRDGLHVSSQGFSTGNPDQYWPVVDTVGPSKPTAALPTAMSKASTLRERIITGICSKITFLYRWCFLALFVCSLLYLCIGWYYTNIAVSPVFALVLASFAAVLSRMMLLAYLDVTAIPSVHILYESSASGFLILAATLGSSELYALIQGRGELGSQLRNAPIFDAVSKA